MDWGSARRWRAPFRPLVERLPKSCKFGIDYFEGVQVCNVKGFRPATENSTRGARTRRVSCALPPESRVRL